MQVAEFVIAVYLIPFTFKMAAILGGLENEICKTCHYNVCRLVGFPWSSSLFFMQTKIQKVALYPAISVCGFVCVLGGVFWLQ